MQGGFGTPLRLTAIAGICLILAFALGAGNGIRHFWTGANAYVGSVQTELRESQLVITPVRPTPTPGVPVLTVRTTGLQLNIYDIHTSTRRLPDFAPMASNEKRLVMNIMLSNKGMHSIEFTPDVLTLTDELGRTTQATHFGLVGNRLLNKGDQIYGELGFTVDRNSSWVVLRCREAGYDTAEAVINLESALDE